MDSIATGEGYRTTQVGSIESPPPSKHSRVTVAEPEKSTPVPKPDSPMARSLSQMIISNPVTNPPVSEFDLLKDEFWQEDCVALSQDAKDTLISLYGERLRLFTTEGIDRTCLTDEFKGLVQREELFLITNELLFVFEGSNTHSVLSEEQLHHLRKSAKAGFDFVFKENATVYNIPADLLLTIIKDRELTIYLNFKFSRPAVQSLLCYPHIDVVDAVIKSIPEKLKEVNTSLLDHALTHCRPEATQALLDSFLPDIDKNITSLFNREITDITPLFNTMLAFQYCAQKCPEHFRKGISRLPRETQQIIMALAACMGQKQMYIELEQMGVTPNFHCAPQPGNLLHYLDRLQNHEDYKNSVQSHGAQAELMDKVDGDCFSTYDAEGFSPIERWMLQTVCSFSIRGSLSSRYAWSTFKKLMVRTDIPVSLDRLYQALPCKNLRMKYQLPETQTRVLCGAIINLLQNNRELQQLQDQVEIKLLTIFKYIHKGKDLNDPASFCEFMTDLITLDSNHFPFPETGQWLENYCPKQRALARPEFQFLANKEWTPMAKANNLDGPPYKFEPLKSLGLITEVSSGLKYQLIASFLEHGNEECVRALLNSWLIRKNNLNAWNWLFHQDLHPNNTVCFEHNQVNALLLAALRLMPAPPNPEGFPCKKNCLAGSLSEEKRTRLLPEKLLSEFSFHNQVPDLAFGRTFLWTDKESGLRHYLKIQSPEESEEQFRLQCDRMSYLYHNSQSLGLKSTCGKPVAQITSNLKDLSILHQIEKDGSPIQQSFRNKLAFGNRLSLYFTLPMNQPYEGYINNGEWSSEQQLDALQRCAEDFGKLWHQGINPPDILSAFHDKKTNRRYYFLAEIAHITNLGLIDRWQTLAQFPNVGITGLRDQMDARHCHDIDRNELSNYGDNGNHTSLPLDPENPMDINRVRLLSLAQGIWGCMLLIADNYLKAEEKGEAFDANKQVTDTLTTFFTHALNMSKDFVTETLKEDDKIAQVMREFVHGITDAAEKEIKSGEIDRNTYPNLPASMTAADDWEFMKCDTSGHLGLMRNGKNPWQALNEIVVKFIALYSLQTGTDTEHL